MRKYLAVIAMVALIVAVGFVARFDQDHDASSKGYDAKCVEPSDPSVDAGALVCTIRPGQNTEQSKDGPTWWHKLLTWPDGITAWALILTLYVITWQAILMRQHAGHFKELAEKTAQSVIATQASAAAMQAQSAKMADQIAVMERQAGTMERQTVAALEQIQDTKNRERARLVLHPKKITEIGVDDLFPITVLEVENVGYSHAFNLRIEARCEISASVDEPPDGGMDEAAIGIIQVGTRSEANIALTYDEEVACAGASNLYAHLWGRGTYDDVYGDSYPLTFRYLMDIQKISALQQRNGRMVLPVMALFGWEEDPKR